MPLAAVLAVSYRARHPSHVFPAPAGTTMKNQNARKQAPQEGVCCSRTAVLGRQLRVLAALMAEMQQEVPGCSTARSRMRWQQVPRQTELDSD